VSSGRAVARSAPFRIADRSGLYATAIDNGVRFLRAQRDGPDVDPSVMDRRPSHLLDEHATVYAPPRYRGLTLASKLRAIGGPVDVSGGWFDAGDYLKFFETASFTETMLLVSLRDHSAAFPDRQAALAEARFGADWLLKMWSPGSGTLLYQVGIGDGNDTSVLGAHDAPWRLPQAEDHLRVKPGSPEYYVAHRPVLRTSPNSGVSPNLAGRGAAAFALCAQVFARSDPAFAQRCLDAAETLYAAARTRRVGRLTTADP
jgi:hypothetical protein